MVYVGMDLHQSYSSIAVLDQAGKTVERSRVAHRYLEELIEYFNQFPQKTPVVMEATCGWSWLPARPRYLN